MIIGKKMVVYALLTAFTLVTGYQLPAGNSPSTRVATWKDNKKAAFMLMFDDSLPSHVNTVVPELTKRGFTGTFYINPAKYNFKKHKKAWEQELPAAGMSYGNHTMTHKSVPDAQTADDEFKKCNEVIHRINPPKSSGKLLSFAVPGVKVWNVSKDELKELLKKHNLVKRPSFSRHGAAVHCKTPAQMCALVDKALANGTCEYIIFHGVGAEYLKVSKADFVTLLDRLAKDKDKIWVASHIDKHKYETERNKAIIKELQNDDKLIKLTLKCNLDKQAYDYPLTLQTNVPTDWQQVKITQGDKSQVKQVSGGTVTYDAIPNRAAIKLTPTN